MRYKTNKQSKIFCQLDKACVAGEGWSNYNRKCVTCQQGKLNVFLPLSD